jgi:hypothetical protein
MLKQWLTFRVSLEQEDRYRNACFGADIKQALQQSERNYRETFDNVSDAIFIHVANGRRQNGKPPQSPICGC